MIKHALIVGASAVTLLSAHQTLAQQPQATSPTTGESRPPQLSQGARSLINLGNAGLLSPFFSNEKFGTAQSRMGSARFAYGAKNSNPNLDDFREGNNILITPVNLMLELPSSSGSSYLRINGARTEGDADPHSLNLGSELYHAELELLHLPNENVMWGIGLVANNFESEDQNSGTEVIRDSRGLRLDYLHKFTDHWGITTRGMYLWGETENRAYNIPTPHGPADLQKKQDDDRYYLQADVVGSWLGDNTRWLPDGTLAHPRFGALYHHSDLGRTTPRLGHMELPETTGVDGADEDFGLAWAHFKLQRAPQATPKFQWLPSVMVGVEHEYENSLDNINDEATYAVVGAGITATIHGQGLFAHYRRHQGINDDRKSNVFVTGITLSF